MEIAATVLAILLALIYMLHTVMLLRRHPMQVQMAETLSVPFDRYRLVAVPEMAAVLGLIVGIWYRPLAAAAAFGLVLLMIGAGIVRARAGDERRNIIGDIVLALIAAAVGVVQVLAI
ncbi:MAG: DoxX family protein [Acidimicrobiia bacterium]